MPLPSLSYLFLEVKKDFQEDRIPITAKMSGVVAELVSLVCVTQVVYCFDFLWKGQEQSQENSFNVYHIVQNVLILLILFDLRKGPKNSTNHIQHVLQRAGFVCKLSYGCPSRLAVLVDSFLCLFT